RLLRSPTAREVRQKSLYKTTKKRPASIKENFIVSDPTRDQNVPGRRQNRPHSRRSGRGLRAWRRTRLSGSSCRWLRCRNISRFFLHIASREPFSSDERFIETSHA